MEPHIIETILNSLEHYLKGKDGEAMPHVQRAVLYACLREPNLSYKEMPAKLQTEGYGQYSSKTLKNDGSTLFKRLRDLFDQEIKKKNCHRKLLDWHNRSSSRTVPQVVKHENRSNSEAPTNLLNFSGWRQDLSDLVNVIQAGRRVICICGAVSSGKTYFSYALVERIQSEFQCVIRCQASDYPTLDSLYKHISNEIQSLNGNGLASLNLVDLLHNRRILLVIDQTEALFQVGHPAGEFQEESRGYEEWLYRLLDAPSNRGCLIWIGQEPPRCFNFQYALHQHKVSRLELDDVHLLMKTHGIEMLSVLGWEKILDFCGGNPTWLLREVSYLQRLSTQNMDQFLTDPSIDFNISEILHYVFERLSYMEQILLFWLLLKPLTYEYIRHLTISGVRSSDLDVALSSLERRSLIRQDINQHYLIDSPLIQHVYADFIVQNIDAELSQDSLDTLKQYPLIHGAASAQRQDWQRIHILKDLKQRFRNRYGFRSEQTTKIHQLIELVRQLPLHNQGYAAGNLINLVVELNLPLADFNLSGLYLCHADLQTANLCGANLNGCSFEHVLFPSNLTGKLVADMPSDGMAIAIGDEDGRLLYWQREKGIFRLRAFCHLPNPIDAILFQESRVLIVVSAYQVYIWWVDGETAPEEIMELPELANCLAHSPYGHIAVGLVNGQIMLRSEISRKVHIVDAHQNEVCNLAFSPNGLSLASVGYGNRVLVWDLKQAHDAVRLLHEISYSSRICTATYWTQNSLIRAETEIGSSFIHVRDNDGVKFDAIVPGGEITALHFSKDGHYLAGSSDAGVLFCWEWSTGELTTFQQGDRFLSTLTACENGRLLLALSGNQIKLYDLAEHELSWKVGAEAVSCTDCDLRQTKHLTFAEKQLLESVGANISDT